MLAATGVVELLAGVVTPGLTAGGETIPPGAIAGAAPPTVALATGIGTPTQAVEAVVGKNRSAAVSSSRSNLDLLCTPIGVLIIS